MIYRQPIDLEVGVDFTSPVFPLYQADGVTPLNLANYTAQLMLRYLATDPSPAISLTQVSSANGQVLLGGPSGGISAPTTASGLVSFTISAAATKTLFDRAGVYSLFLVPTSGPILYAVGGPWTLTRPAVS